MRAAVKRSTTAEARSATARGQRGVLQQLANRACQIVGVAWRGQYTGAILQQLLRPPCRGRRNWDAQGHRLEQRRAQPLVTGARHENVCIGDEAGGLVDPAEEVDTAVERERGAQPLEGVPFQRPSPATTQCSEGQGAGEPRGGAKQGGVVLFPGQRADVRGDDGIGREPQLLAHSEPGRGANLGHRDAGVDDRDPVAGDPAGPSASATAPRDGDDAARRDPRTRRSPERKVHPPRRDQGAVRQAAPPARPA